MAGRPAPPNLVGAFGPQSTEITVTYTIPASSAVGTIIAGSLTAFGPLAGAVTSVFVPVVEIWHIVDIYVVGAPVSADAFVVTIVNGYVQNIQPKISSVNLNLLTRFKMTDSIPIPPASQFSSSIDLLAAAPATQFTQTVTYRIVKAPFTG